jgi:hypothetical protein
LITIDELKSMARNNPGPGPGQMDRGRTDDLAPQKAKRPPTASDDSDK